MISILFLAPVDFDNLYYKKIVIPLAESNIYEIYVINRPADLIIDALRGYKRFRKIFLSMLPQKGKIKVFVPFVLFNEVIHESLCGWGNINMRILIWQVKRIIKREGINTDKLILWSYSPFHWKVMKEIPAKRKIYGVEDEYCYDHKDRLRKKTYNAEKKMILFSDEIICGSEKLKEKFEKMVPQEKKIHLISNLADNRSFQKCNIKEYLSWDIIPDPKAVIFGVIRSQIDLALIERLVIKIPNMSIVFIGKAETGKYKNKAFKGLLRNYQNIYHLGYLSRDKIIYCLRSSAIGLYPGKNLTFSVYANPIRIYEYAAAGIPVVASNINRESDYPKSIVVVDNDTDFIEAVETILKNGIIEDDKEELIKFAKKHSAIEIVKRYKEVFQKAINS